MSQKNVRIYSLVVLVCFTIFLGMSPEVISGALGTGKVVGNVYQADGTTPLPGAVVMVKNISTGQVTSSLKTDRTGFFTISGLEKGIYAFGVRSNQGDFESNRQFGIEPNKTSRISISVTPYDDQTASAVKELYQNKNDDDEVLVGRVVGFDAPTRMAEVYVFKGFIQSMDRIRVLGSSTDFYQDVKSLQLGGQSVSRVLAGQNAVMKMDYDVALGDDVYVVCKKGAFPFFLTPLGIASIIAGSAAIIYGGTELVDEPEEVSTFRK